MNRRGFTLIELLAGMGILVTVLGLFTLAELTARSTVERHAALLDVEQESARIAHFLRQDLAAALAVEITAPAAAPEPGTEPGEDTAPIARAVATLTMAARTPTGDPAPGATDTITYRLLPLEDDRWQLERVVTPAPTSDLAAESRILARRLLALELTPGPRHVVAYYELQPITRMTAKGQFHPHSLHIERRPALGGRAR